MENLMYFLEGVTTSANNYKNTKAQFQSCKELHLIVDVMYVKEITYSIYNGNMWFQHVVHFFICKKRFTYSFTSSGACSMSPNCLASCMW